MMTNSAIKLNLLQSNVAVKKRNNDLAFLMGGADMLQSGDENLRAWFWAERGLILNQIPATPTPPPPPSPTDDASATPSSTEAVPTSPEATSTPPSPHTPTTTPEVELDV